MVASKMGREEVCCRPGHNPTLRHKKAKGGGLPCTRLISAEDAVG